MTKEEQIWGLLKRVDDISEMAEVLATGGNGSGAMDAASAAATLVRVVSDLNGMDPSLWNLPKEAA